MNSRLGQAPRFHIMIVEKQPKPCHKHNIILTPLLIENFEGQSPSKCHAHTSPTSEPIREKKQGQHLFRHEKAKPLNIPGTLWLVHSRMRTVPKTSFRSSNQHSVMVLKYHALGSHGGSLDAFKVFVGQSSTSSLALATAPTLIYGLVKTWNVG
ncbi:hypothetical protein VNO77_26895 [Canavalia gladiata]|uniref:Uncharacterized protein n=1 Tax=Canavalia gladiata TaxID=3824 RepID=A0AAN9KXW1_CANGL